MSIRQLSTDTRIALNVAESEFKAVMMLGGTVRDAIERSSIVFDEVLAIAQREAAREHMQ